MTCQFKIEEIQRDATVRRYLFTAKLLYMFRASIAPIIRKEYIKPLLQLLVQIILYGGGSFLKSDQIRKLAPQIV